MTGQFYVQQITYTLVVYMHELWFFLLVCSYSPFELCPGISDPKLMPMLLFVKILPEMYLWTRKSPLNLARHLDLDMDPGIFSGILLPQRRSVLS